MNAKSGLTPRQRQVLDYIIKYIEDSNGVSPTHQEIADHFQIGVRKVHGHVESLVDRGWLSKLPYKQRSLWPV